MRNARSRKVTAVLCTLIGLVSVALVTALARGDDGPTPANSGSPFQLVTASYAAGDSWYANRINKTTGEAWDLSQDGTSWVKMTENGQLPSGDYNMRILPYGSGSNANAEVLRIERKTGKSWANINGNWTALTEPK